MKLISSPCTWSSVYHSIPCLPTCRSKSILKHPYCVCICNTHGCTFQAPAILCAKIWPCISTFHFASLTLKLCPRAIDIFHPGTRVVTVHSIFACHHFIYSIKLQHYRFMSKDGQFTLNISNFYSFQHYTRWMSIWSHYICHLPWP